MGSLRDTGRRLRRLLTRVCFAGKGTLARLAGGKVVSLRNIQTKSDYLEYLKRQKSKTEDPRRVALWLGEEWEAKLSGFKDLFGKFETSLLDKTRTCLCVGARTGQEVVALLEMGHDAIGIDLVSFPPHVIEGDMHSIPFNDGKFDFVFCNVIDHSPFPDKAISELERVCSHGGFIVVYLQEGMFVDEFSENLIIKASTITEFFQNSKIIESKKTSTTFDGMTYYIVAQRALA